MTGLAHADTLLHRWQRMAREALETLEAPLSWNMQSIDFESLTNDPEITCEEELLFVNGRFILQGVPEGCRLLPLSQAVMSHSVLLQESLLQRPKRTGDYFSLLNLGLLREGAWLYVLPGKHVGTLRVLHVVTEPALCASRLHVIVGRGSSLSLKMRRLDRVPPHCIHENHFLVEEGARFTFEDMPVGTMTTHVEVKASGSFEERGMQSRSATRRYLARLNGEGAQLDLLGGVRLGSDAQARIEVRMEHLAPRGRSLQRFKSVLSDRARTFFTGRIVVAEGAVETEAYQQSRALLLGREAFVSAKPELEIATDEVKASHGATVGQLDEQALLYARARGIPLAEARELLIEGFFQDILAHG